MNFVLRHQPGTSEETGNSKMVNSGVFRHKRLKQDDNFKVSCCFFSSFFCCYSSFRLLLFFLLIFSEFLFVRRAIICPFLFSTITHTLCIFHGRCSLETEEVESCAARTPCSRNASAKTAFTSTLHKQDVQSLTRRRSSDCCSRICSSLLRFFRVFGCHFAQSASV
jgi:hypothetical protein